MSAAPPVDGGAPDAMHEGRHDGFHKGMHDGVYFPGLGPVSKKQLEQLKLDDKQQALVKTAQDSQRGLRDAMRAPAPSAMTCSRRSWTAASSTRAR